AVLPSDDSETEVPLTTPPEPTSFGPCCVNWARAAGDEISSAARASPESPRIRQRGFPAPFEHAVIETVRAGASQSTPAATGHRKAVSERMTRPHTNTHLRPHYCTGGPKDT